MLTALLILTALCSSNIRNVTQCSGSSYTYSITHLERCDLAQKTESYTLGKHLNLYLQHYAAVISAMLFNAAAAILTALLILTLCSSNIRNVTQCSSSNYTYSITYTYITQLYLHYAAVTSAMLLNAAAATILTALLILTLRSYTYIMQQ